ncbi:deoxyribose-phosphate aldolase [Sediminibacterium sp.]|jgi:deoxyribose-phosphate aldolase|uniref:deoxyribose-phosphate aldolase n=1 Tax=Sediminibacterium sp. TaxID=1917865 RepID=UPI000BD75087|nr:deoxyribose-phosphate aldolase [Sediminibacterium sp.]OYY12064.1 MAG: deoxyribose-phosphate aldolase [Sphingobacteriia bacterium 35-36-14]OYZ54897.1 MAG: deoxyribose-phosphate aldolase [Sphingobacteriia bacterium 24-36-13]OZA66155.1 MAG: deoxyribose-phosphate aldolase [Sphingobacteriia bacterium 39-36-14]MDO8995113.1 deoxyribose-phosphate aldolase [Sediminibacterium sp.]MDP1973090.1 deoxyribose-phosphate aldolase [Sediminibacterium sp.]
MHLATYIDHTILKPTTLVSEVAQICKEAAEYKFAAVCVPPNFVKKAKEFLVGTNVKVATVIGFPFGYSAVEAKLAEIVLAMVDGVDELDVVANISAIKNQDWVYLANELNHIMPVVKSKNKTIKIIIESGILTNDEIIKCCELYGVAGIDYLKTSTGYAEKGASVEAVKLFRLHLPDAVQIKASGGIRDYTFAAELVEAGATRLGCSASLAIVKGEPNTNNATY